VYAQQADDPSPLVTDRPDFTESAVSVPQGRVQFEGGYTWSRKGNETSHSIGDLLVRWGIVGGVEARLGLNSFEIVERPDSTLDGLQDVELGAKIDAVHLLGWPRSSELALIVGTATPTGDSGTGSQEWQPTATLAFAFDASENLSLGTNAGLRWPVDDGQRYLEGAISAALGFGLSERWGTYFEVYTILPEGSRPDELFVNGGVTFLTSTEFQLDARIGSMVAGSTWPNLFAGAGLSWRI
jgi:hypothetical protein